MTQLSRSQVLELNEALSTADVKTKHISGENFMKVLKLKNQLKKDIALLHDGEIELSKAHSVRIEGSKFVAEDPDKKEDFKAFVIKLKEFQKSFISQELVLNFIPRKEFLEYTKETTIDDASVLYEYLLMDKDV